MSEPAKPSRTSSLVIAALLLVGAGLLAINELSESELLPEGNAAPPFVLERLRGGTVSLEQYRGRVVLVDFWATWCPPCNEEMPWLVKVAAEYGPRGVAFVAISQDDAEDAPSVVPAYVQRLPALGASVAFGRPEVGEAYQVEALPTLYVIDAKGRVVASHTGLASETRVRAWLEKALAKN
jgi:thiol-disulfide isomerase/thioredoxin